MGFWRVFVAWGRKLRTMLRRSEFEREMDEEMRHHLELEIEDRMRQGMSPADARRTAHRDFGGVDRQKERAREARGLAALDGVLQDLTFGLRVFRHRPVFAATAVVTLAIGIALPTVIFSFSDAVLFRPPPGVADADRLVQVHLRAPHLEDQDIFVSQANLRDLQAMELPALTHLVGWASSRAHVALPGQATTILSVGGVVGDYFGALGVRPSAGRLFRDAGTEVASGADGLVISEYARRRLFGDEDPVGRTLSVNGVPLTVIGVADQVFRGTDRARFLDLWVPFPVYPRIRHREARTYFERSATNLTDVVARLAPGATGDEAQAQLRQGMDRLVERFPRINEAYADYRPTVFPDIGISPFARAGVQATVAAMLTAAGLVLLVACANVANLLIFSGVRRRGESAARRALGASRLRLVRQHLTESALLAAAGVAGGLLLTFLLLEAYTRWILPESAGPPPLGLDHRVTAFAALAGAVSVLLAGLVPAVTVGRFQLSEVLKGGGRSDTGRKAKLRAFLTTAQLAVSLALVVGALLMERTVRNLVRVDLGYETESIVLVGVDPEPQGYEPERANALRGELLRLAADLPGVEAVGAAAEGPMAVNFVADLRAADDPGDEWPVEAYRDEVTPGFFETLGIPVVRGRGFNGEELARSFESTSAGVAVVSETLARRLWGDVDAVGRRVVSRGFRENTVLEVVGVVADHRTRSLDEPMAPLLYQPLGDGFSRGMVLFARSQRPPVSVTQDLRGLLDRLDPALPFHQAGTLEARVRAEAGEERFLARLMVFLAAVAGLMAGVGLYGVVAGGVAEGTREIGIRMAMGARAGRVVGGVLRQSLALVTLGIVTGSGLAWLLTRFLRRWLFGVDALDPLVWTVAPAAFLVLGALAALAPARSAARVDPVKTLRS